MQLRTRPYYCGDVISNLFCGFQQCRYAFVILGEVQHRTTGRACDSLHLKVQQISVCFTVQRSAQNVGLQDDLRREAQQQVVMSWNDGQRDPFSSHRIKPMDLSVARNAIGVAMRAFLQRALRRSPPLHATVHQLCRDHGSLGWRQRRSWQERISAMMARSRWSRPACAGAEKGWIDSEALARRCAREAFSHGTDNHTNKALLPAAMLSQRQCRSI
jgi:hypothetical protein